MSATIDLYIKSVLQEAEAVALLGVGTLYKVQRSARMDPSTGKVLPPEVSLRFQGEVDRTVLIGKQLVKHLRMPVDEAQAVEMEITKTLRTQLREQGRYALRGLGTLYRNELGELRFEGEDSAWSELAGDFFGLQPVGMPDLPPRGLSLSQAENEHSMNPSGTNSPRAGRGISWKTFLLILLLPTLAFSLLRYSPLRLSRSSRELGPRIAMMPPAAEGNDALEQGNGLQEDSLLELREEPPTPPQLAQESEIPPAEEIEAEAQSAAPASPNAGTNARTSEDGYAAADSEGRGTAGHLSDLNQTEDGSIVADSPQAGARTRGFSEPDTIYYLIAGSFSQQDGALQRMRELRNKGYKSAVLVPPEGSSAFYRVTIYRNASEAQVQAYADKLRARGLSA